MTRVAILALRALLVCVVLGLLFIQIVVIPIGCLEFGREIGLPAAGVFAAVNGIAFVVCIEVAMLAVWVLLGMVRRDAIFAERAFRWVDVIIVAGLVATALAIAGAVHLYVVVRPIIDAPGLVVVAGTVVLCSAAFVALMVVMRGLLRTATGLRGELDEVV